MKIKYLSCLAAFIITASFALTAFAVSEITLPLSSAPYRVNSDTRLSGSYEGERTPVEIYGATTITLENANISVTGTDAYGIKINTNANTTIILLGENHISSSDTIGIISNSNIVFAGTGSLNVTGLNQSIYVDGRLTIGSGVAITSGNTGRTLTISEATSIPMEEDPFNPPVEDPPNPPADGTAPVSERPVNLPFEELADALVTDTRVMVDEVEVSFECYNIEGNNYFKLRDLAMALNGSAASFSVEWNAPANLIALTRGEAYEPTGTELMEKELKNEIALKSSSQVLVNRVEIAPTAYNIEGSNFYKLRDLGDELNFSVDWDGENRVIIINTQVAQ